MLMDFNWSVSVYPGSDSFVFWAFTRMYKGSRMINTHNGNLFDYHMQRFHIDFGGEVEIVGYPIE